MLEKTYFQSPPPSPWKSKICFKGVPAPIAPPSAPSGTVILVLMKINSNRTQGNRYNLNNKRLTAKEIFVVYLENYTNFSFPLICTVVLNKCRNKRLLYVPFFILESIMCRNGHSFCEETKFSKRTKLIVNDCDIQKN